MAMAMLATGCDSEAGVSDDSAAWRTSIRPVTTSGLAWASGSTVHLSDGTTIDTGSGFVNTFVVAGDGVFFVPAASEEGAGSGFSDAKLQFAAPGKPVIDTGVVVSDFWSFAASEDGRYLVAIDPTAAGVEDRFHTPQATTVAFDLATGEQVVDSTMGMGDPASDDFADGYSYAEMQILALTETSLYVRTFDDVVFDLATGVGEEVRDEPWREDVDELTSPDGEWRIERAAEGPSRIVGTNGQAVTPSTKGPRWNLFGWADDRTAVGTYITGPNTGNRSKSGDSVALMSCAVPAGECQVFEETEGETVTFPAHSTQGHGIILRWCRDRHRSSGSFALTGDPEIEDPRSRECP